MLCPQEGESAGGSNVTVAQKSQTGSTQVLDCSLPRLVTGLSFHTNMTQRKYTKKARPRTGIIFVKPSSGLLQDSDRYTLIRLYSRVIVNELRNLFLSVPALAPLTMAIKGSTRKCICFVASLTWLVLDLKVKGTENSIQLASCPSGLLALRMDRKGT